MYTEMLVIITPTCGDSLPGSSVVGHRVGIAGPTPPLGTPSREGGEQEAWTEVWGEWSCSGRRTGFGMEAMGHLGPACDTGATDTQATTITQTGGTKSR